MAGDFLPVVYHENVLFLMVQQPDVIFAYWDMSSGHLQTIGDQKQLILCLYKNNQLNRKIALPPFTNNWYFRDVEPDHVYFCELGFSGAGFGNTFIPLLRSNRVTTPRITPGEEDKWETRRVTVAVDASLSEPEERYKVKDLVNSQAFYMGFQPGDELINRDER